MKLEIDKSTEILKLVGQEPIKRIRLTSDELEAIKKVIRICEKGFELEKALNEWTDDDRADSDFARAECDLLSVLADYNK